MLVRLWFDRRQVAMLSLNCNPSEWTTVQRCTKTPPYIKDAEIPAPVHWYNHSMGGVDLNSQLRSYYPSGRSGKKWWRFIFWYTLDVSICNTFIIEGLSSHAPSARSRTHLQFRLELAKQLIGRFCGSIPVNRERLHPLTMPCPSQTYQVITR